MRCQTVHTLRIKVEQNCSDVLCSRYIVDGRKLNAYRDFDAVMLLNVP